MRRNVNRNVYNAGKMYALQRTGYVNLQRHSNVTRVSSSHRSRNVVVEGDGSDDGQRQWHGRRVDGADGAAVRLGQVSGAVSAIPQPGRLAPRLHQHGELRAGNSDFNSRNVIFGVETWFSISGPA